MKVKFTEPVTQKVKYGAIDENFRVQVKYGVITEVITGTKGLPALFVIQGDEGGRYIVNPNSDYNFRFIKNEEAQKAWSAAIKELVDKHDL